MNLSSKQPLRVQFSSVQYIHIVVKRSLETLSCIIEILYTLNTNTSSSLLLALGNHLSISIVFTTFRYFMQVESYSIYTFVTGLPHLALISLRFMDVVACNQISFLIRGKRFNRSPCLSLHNIPLYTCIVGPWTAWVWTAWTHVYMDFFNEYL